MTVINLKLPEDVRIHFHEAVKRHGVTMQSVLSAFVMSYIDSPENFKFKMEVVSGNSKDR